MDQELKRLLGENLELSKENNKILKKMQSGARWGRFFRLLYWIIILSVMFGVYYFVQPILEGLMASYQGLVTGLGGIQDATNSLPDLSVILDKLPSKQ